MTTFNIRTIDIEEYLRGQDDRAKGYPITAHGDDTVDQHGQATDAYCAGYDPRQEIVGFQPEHETEGKAFQDELRRVAESTHRPAEHKAPHTGHRTYRIAAKQGDAIHLRHNIAACELGNAVARLLGQYKDAHDMRITLESPEDFQEEHNQSNTKD